MELSIPVEEMVERFLRYVAIDTQSNEESESYPSTARQLDLSRVLVQELRGMGVTDAGLTEHGYVFATVPATSDKEVPVIGLIAHVDTSPEVSGAGVRADCASQLPGRRAGLAGGLGPGDPAGGQSGARAVYRPRSHYLRRYHLVGSRQ